MLSNMSTEIEITRLELETSDTNQCKIQYFDYTNLNYSIFFENVMIKNLPCLLKNVANSWECSKHWVLDNDINYDYLLREYGDLVAPVADCDSINFNSQCKKDMKVRDFICYLKDNNKTKLLYLKDWHLRRTMPYHNFYKVPHIFASDWLNEYSIDCEEDDFMFVYIGPKGSWTPLHCDVYSSFSWSVNVVGKKKWILLPPGEEEKLKDSLNNLPILFEPDKYPNVKYIEVNQEMGDGIFVPSGWHHQVFNLLDTISINHNFINSCNIEVVWKALSNNLLSVEHEIKEFKGSSEFSEQCQLILKSVFGMDCISFLEFLLHISKKRIKQFNCNNPLVLKMFLLGKKHIYYDLFILLKIINSIQNHAIYHLLPQNIITNLINVKDSINKTLKL